MTNRLAESTSPYLLQHKDNPVDWWPWTPEAFAEAERRGVPVLLSVGYAACHWCHVMAHESFEDPETAALMNELFVCVKVDREERPDVDAVYMEATQAMTGHGGWPMTVFLTAGGDPFFCGTYFPPDDRHGMPSFRTVLHSVARAWTERRDDVLTSATQITKALAERSPVQPGTEPPGAQHLDGAARALAASYDGRRGGFGGAPKFPPSMCLEFLLRHHARTADPNALRMVEGTCDAMARGGMYDQLGGGFARYSVDADWVVPHFEKMLYDNALLLRVYAHWWRATGSPLARRVALETAEFLVDDLGTAEGGFASALDADSEGEEGRYYVWTPGELAKVLGDDDGAWAARVWNVTEQGTFEHGSSVLQRLAEPDDEQRYERVRAALLAARRDRVPPARDDKVVAAWNGLAIAGLAEAGALLDRPDLVDAARRATALMRELHWSGGRLLRTSRDGRAGRNAGVLEDYGDLAEGLLALYGVTGDAALVAWAGELLDVVLERFAAPEGGFYDTADDAEALVRRPQDPTDNATPSGSSAAAGALLSYAALTGSSRHRAAAERALAAVTPLLNRHARFVGHAASVGEALVAGPSEVAVVGDPGDPATTALLRAAWRGTAPGAVVAFGGGDVPLLADRPLVEGRPAAYVCRGFTCAAPVTDRDALRALVGGRPE
ncbi:MAG TPA: thioredoxin domain-containing protein [Mycobacteriales bacterium]|nr:thioredoxin domain-containing protein [Mycobacteriales bacterium]